MNSIQYVAECLNVPLHLVHLDNLNRVEQFHIP